MNSALRPYATAGVALVGAGVIVATPVTAPLSGAHVPGIQLAAGDDGPTDIVIDILRHGERAAPYNHLQIPSPPHPGPPLSETGEQQAQDVAEHLNNVLGDDVAGIFSGQGIRDKATAAPFALIEGQDEDWDTPNGAMPVHILPGLNEIDFGIYGLKPLTSFGGILSQLHVLLWAAGFELTPMPGSGQDPNGVVFDEKFTSAINHMYNFATAPEDPVVSDNGEITTVAFNNEGSVAVWVELHVQNPDFPFFLARGIQSLIDPDGHGILPPTGIVQIKGNPEEGWTLVSWDGHPIPQDPGLLTSLLVDFREPLIASQQATWHIWDAILGGDQDTIQDALQTGFANVSSAYAELPGAVFNDIADALADPASAFSDITDAWEYLADDSGSAAGETAAMLGDSFAALF